MAYNRIHHRHLAAPFLVRLRTGCSARGEE